LNLTRHAKKTFKFDDIAEIYLKKKYFPNGKAGNALKQASCEIFGAVKAS
jgi:hypothetical protein